jgi:hypothetical protein
MSRYTQEELALLGDDGRAMDVDGSQHVDGSQLQPPPPPPPPPPHPWKFTNTHTTDANNIEREIQLYFFVKMHG